MGNLEKSLQDALARESAIREIARRISGSPTDYRPAFDTILENTTRLCDAAVGLIYIRRNDGFHLVAARGGRPEFIEFAYAHPLPLDPAQSVTGQAAAECRPIQVLDMDSHELTKAGQFHRAAASKLDTIRTQLSIPMVRNDNAIGAIVIFRRIVDAFDFDQIELLNMFAEQAVLAVDNVRQARALQTCSQELSEALERQTATSEILQVIGSSPTDFRPVFEAILDNACRLCDAPLGVLFLAYDDGLRGVATRGARPAFVEFLQRNPSPLDPTQSMSARAMFECVPLHGEDLADEQALLDHQPHHVAAVDIEGVRAFLAIPIHKDRQPVGVIGLYRREAQAFESKHTELVSAFAHQAVIAIENLRLLQAAEASTKDLDEALARQTATREILQTIGRSPTDDQSLFATILENAARLSDTPLAALFIRRADALELVAQRGGRAEFVQYMKNNPLSLDPARSLGARALLERKPLHCEDAATEEIYQAGEEHLVAAVETEGMRTCLYLPLRKGDSALGIIILYRREVRAFESQRVELVASFAEHACIAIENARLFQTLEARAKALNEVLETRSREYHEALQARTREHDEALHASTEKLNKALETRTAELNEALDARAEELGGALDRQAATGEILRMLSRSSADCEPVFDAILETATRTCDAPLAALFMKQEDGFHLVAHKGAPPEFVAAAQNRPVPLDPALTLGGRAAHECVALQDVAREPQYGENRSELAATMESEGGIRTYLVVPLVKNDESIGIIGLYRRDVRPFEEDAIAVMRAFADQAVIAIDTARLHEALAAKTKELACAVEELRSPPGEADSAESATLELASALTEIIEQAIEVSDADGGAICEFDEHTGTLPVRAACDPAGALAGLAPVQLGQGIIGQAAAVRAPVQVPDMQATDEHSEPLHSTLQKSGLEALLAVPLLRHEHLLGVLLIARKDAGEFADEKVTLIDGIAARAALAIRNAWLFREIADKARELEAANQRKSQYLALLSGELRAPLDTVIGYCEVLAEQTYGELNDRQQEYLHDIQSAGRHLLALINYLLDLARIEAGRIKLDLVRIAIRPALENALTFVGERATRRNIALETDIANELGEMQADGRKFRQILLNLLSNAIKFTPEGGTVTLAARRDGADLHIAVRDTGVGVSTENRKILFDEIRQLGITSGDKVDSSGLGLALTQRFVELHGGKIELESAPGEGSEFRIVLPVEPPDSEEGQ